MRRYFFDLVSDRRLEYDYRRRDFAELGAAEEKWRRSSRLISASSRNAAGRVGVSMFAMRRGRNSSECLCRKSVWRHRNKQTWPSPLAIWVPVCVAGLIHMSWCIALTVSDVQLAPDQKTGTLEALTLC
jgi:hypothetical protein